MARYLEPANAAGRGVEVAGFSVIGPRARCRCCRPSLCTFGPRTCPCHMMHICCPAIASVCLTGTAHPGSQPLGAEPQPLTTPGSGSLGKHLAHDPMLHKCKWTSAEGARALQCSDPLTGLCVRYYRVAAGRVSFPALTSAFLWLRPFRGFANLWPPYLPTLPCLQDRT